MKVKELFDESYYEDNDEDVRKQAEQGDLHNHLIKHNYQLKHSSRARGQRGDNEHQYKHSETGEGVTVYQHRNRESNWNYSGKNGYITKTGKGSNSLVKHLTSKKQ